MDKEIREKLKQLPAVDLLLRQPAIAALAEAASQGSRTAVKQAVQTVLVSIREELAGGRRSEPPEESEWAALIGTQLDKNQKLHLTQVVNATGTILHTNLGRSILSDQVRDHLLAAACSYSNLEYDLEEGQRGSRYSHLNKILQVLTGAEDVLIVNNNAAAVFLVLNTLAKDREVVISRGELVEIGGFFRIPEVIQQSGGIIREVGTTNKTHLEDYRQVIQEATGAIMKVHTSNYRIIGFTENVETEALSSLAKEKNIPLINDLGSGLFINMERFGLPYEPTVGEALAQGCDVVTFSGDKLLGGPQAGIIVGKKRYIEQMKKNQLLRALRVDKMTLAALEATLHLYIDDETAVRHIPVLSMLALTEEECRQKAEALAALLKTMSEQEQALNMVIEIVQEHDVVGGGSYPEYMLPGYAVALRSDSLSAAEIEEGLRRYITPVISRVHRDQVLLAVRTIRAEEFSIIAEAVKSLQS